MPVWVKKSEQDLGMLEGTWKANSLVNTCKTAGQRNPKNMKPMQDLTGDI